MNLPADLGDRLAVQTDARGRATLDVGAADEVEVVRVVSGPFGVQQLRMPRPDAAGVRTLRLMPVGRVVGQIQAGDPRAVRGLAVRVRTDPDPAADVARVGGFASVVTDDQGRFTIPAIAAGTLVVSVRVPLGPPLARPAGRPAAGPARHDDRGHDPPPAGGAGQGRRPGRHRAAGRSPAWACVCCHGTSMIPWLAAMPRDGSPPTSRRAGSSRIPSTCPAAITTPQTSRQPADAARGDGRAHAGADRAAPGRRAARAQSSTRRENPCRGRASPVTWNWPTDPTAGASARSPTARGDSGSPACRPTRRSTSRPPAARRRPRRPCSVPSSKGTIDLTIGPENAVALVGRVKDPAGRPVAGAAVRVSARKRNPNDIPVERFTVAFDDEGRTILRTGADGQFRTPKRLRPDLEYQRRRRGRRLHPGGHRMDPAGRSEALVRARPDPPAGDDDPHGGRPGGQRRGPADRRRRRVPVGRRAGAHAAPPPAPTADSGCRASTASRRSSSSRRTAWPSRGIASVRATRPSS